MKQEGLGEFQELILLAIMVLGDNAYGVSIQDEIRNKAKRKVSRGALHSALSRLTEKGFLISKMGGASQERGGRRKRLFTLTQKGSKALIAAKNNRQTFYEEIERLELGRI